MKIIGQITATLGVPTLPLPFRGQILTVNYGENVVNLHVLHGKDQHYKFAIEKPEGFRHPLKIGDLIRVYEHNGELKLGLHVGTNSYGQIIYHNII